MAEAKPFKFAKKNATEAKGSAASLKDIKVRGGTCKRLALDAKMYSEEKKQGEAKLQQLTQASADPYEIKKQRQLCAETDATLADVLKRTKTAVKDLRALMTTLADQKEITGSEEWTQAAKHLTDAAAVVGEEPAVPAPKAADSASAAPASSPSPTPLSPLSPSTAVLTAGEAKSPGAFKVAVFGSSRCVRGDALWAYADKVGQALAAKGYHVVNGGYGGTMEAMSEGARRERNAVVEGVICPTVFVERGKNGNKFLTIETPTPSLQERIHYITRNCAAFVALPGNIGTLTELSMVWNLSVIAPLSGAPKVPIFATRDPWEKCLKGIADSLGVSKVDMERVVFFDTPEELVALLAKLG